MIKYIVFMFGLLLFSSCNENESESFITKEMKNYISNNVDGSYGFFERNMVKEHIDSFSWKSDIYRIQRQLYMYASQRRTILANNYVPLTKTTGWLFPNIFESNFEKPQGYAKKIKESYITEEEREICDYIYYSESVPKIRKMIKDLEEEEFHGDRIYYACGYRTASGAIVDRQFVLYTNGEKNFIEIFELIIVINSEKQICFPVSSFPKLCIANEIFEFKSKIIVITKNEKFIKIPQTIILMTKLDGDSILEYVK
jgi:hypothetical protein